MPFRPIRFPIRPLRISLALALLSLVSLTRFGPATLAQPSLPGPASVPVAPVPGAAAVAPAPTPFPGPRVIKPLAIEGAGQNAALREGRITLKPIENLSEATAGTSTVGTWGDILLANNHVRAIIGNPDNGPDDLLRSGSLIDLARTAENRDSLGVFTPHWGTELKADLRTLRITYLAKGIDDGGVCVRVEQESVSKKGLRVTTDYILAPDSPELRIVSDWQNNTTSTLAGFAVADILQFSTATTFLPASGPVPLNTAAKKVTDFVAGLTPANTFLFTGPREVTAVIGQGALQAIHKTEDFPAGKRISIERRIIVGDRDIATLSERALLFQKQDYGYIRGRLVQVALGPDKKAVAVGAVSGGEVVAVMAKRGDKVVAQAISYSRTFSDAGGEFKFPLPVGVYHLQGRKYGYSAPDAKTGLEVKKGQTLGTDLTLGPAGRIEVTCFDGATSAPIPAKITLENLVGTGPADFGPDHAARGKNVVYSAGGVETLLVAPGTYRLVVSRGPEYTTFEKRLRISIEETKQVSATIRRVVSTPGWISLDAGVHTTATSGCLVTPEDRVTAAAAEGVEWIVSGDERAATDLTAAIEKLGLKRHLRASIGRRILATGANPLGQFLVWPLKPGAPEPPAPPATGYDPGAYFKQLRETYPGALITVSRPIFPEVGYYALAGAGNGNPVPTRPGFSRDFDLIEVWEGKRVFARQPSVAVYWNERMLGNPISPIAVSNSISLVGEETGYPRTYVYVGTDNLDKVTEADLVAGLKGGRVVLTNGPFIDYRVMGERAGALVKPRPDMFVNYETKVYAAPWINTFQYQLDQDGDFVSSVIQPGANLKEILRYPRENDDPGREYNVRTGDTALSISVNGARGLQPVVGPSPEGQNSETLPYAMSGPIFVDVDGDGKFVSPVARKTPPKPRTTTDQEEVQD